MTPRRRLLGIRGQFLLLLVAILVGVTTITATIAARSQRNQLLHERKLRGDAVLRSWSSLCRERLLSDESVNLAMWDFIDELMRGETSVVDVYLLDTAGIFLMHEQPAKVGTRGAPIDSMKVWLGRPGAPSERRSAQGSLLRFGQVIEVSGKRLGLARVEFSSAGIEEGIKESIQRIFLFAAIIALFGVVVASGLIVQVTRPIHLLVEGVRRFGEQFDPEDPESADVRIEFRSFNEIGDVRDSFNEMTRALRTSMAERRSLKEESGFLRIQATTDALTGLFNKRQFEEDFPVLVDLAARKQRPLCLLMLDMDRFKLLNDTLGHAEGDRALKDLAQSIRERTRTSERAYRIGGDEFVLISIGTSIEDARAISDRITEEYHRRKAPDNPTSISFGIVAYDGQGTAEALLKASDEEMYRVKRLKKAMA